MPKDEDVAIDDIVVGATGIMKRIPQEIRSTFTYEQSAAIAKAFPRTHHDVNIRVSLPLPWGRRYFVLFSGNERRSKERRRLQRLCNPLYTAMNVITLAIIGFLFLCLAVNLVNMFVLAFF